MIVIIRCGMCTKSQYIEVTEDEYKNYCNGMKVQHAFPNLTANQREMFISQTCDTCWNKIFPNGDN